MPFKGSTSRFGDNIQANLAKRPKPSPPAEHSEKQLDTTTVSTEPQKQPPVDRYHLPYPLITLDPSVREVAKREPIMAAFVKAMDDIMDGIVDIMMGRCEVLRGPTLHRRTRKPVLFI